MIESAVKALSDTNIDISATPGLKDAFFTTPDPFNRIDSSYLHEKFYSKHTYELRGKYILL